MGGAIPGGMKEILRRATTEVNTEIAQRDSHYSAIISDRYRIVLHSDKGPSGDNGAVVRGSTEIQDNKLNMECYETLDVRFFFRNKY
jgi:hypothetical protein